jgi:hypothetical protein
MVQQGQACVTLLHVIKVAEELVNAGTISGDQAVIFNASS